jgi:isopenicillin N synthase-like dioxygenase
VNDKQQVPFDAIPVVDLRPWFSGDARARERIARQVNRICREVGFMYVKNHGISESLVERTFKQAHRFFSLPEDEKVKLHYMQTGGHRGYLPTQAESSDPTAKADLKEGFDCGLVLQPVEPTGLALARMMAPNLWPGKLPSFRETVEQYFDSVWKLARIMFRMFALSFGVREDFFEDKIDRPIATLRLLHYPPQPVPELNGNLGIGAHCDYECFTILAQDEVGGLQVQNTAGEWIEAPPIPRTFVINIGEMLSRWTNGLFVATPHRVINITGRERYSIPFFFATNNETVIECLDSCCGEHNRAKYPPIAAGQYLAGRLQEIYGV